MAALLTLCPATSLGQVRRVELTWQAPPGCPSFAEVTREVDELVAASPSATATPISANGSVASDRGGFVLTLALRDTEGTHFRRIDAPTCEELGHAAALVVALAIDPALLSTHVDPGGAVTHAPPSYPVNASEPALAPNKVSQVAPSPVLPQWPVAPPPLPAQPPQRLFWRLGLSESVAIGTLPGVNLGTGLFGAVQTRVLRFELGVSNLTGNATARDKPSASADFSLYRVEPKACWLVENSTWALGPCSGFEIGLLSGQGHGVDNPRSERSAWIASNHGGLFEVRLSSSTLLGAIAEAEIPWLQEDFKLSGQIVYRPKVSFRAGISLAAGWQ